MEALRCLWSIPVSGKALWVKICCRAQDFEVSRLGKVKFGWLFVILNDSGHYIVIKIMKHIITIIFFLTSLMAVHNAFAQYDYDDGDLKPRKSREHTEEVQEKQPDQTPVSDKKFDKSKLRIGGNLGLSFGSFIFINLSPAVSYLVHERVEVGAGFIFQYVNYRNYYRDNYGLPELDKNITYGANIWPRVYIWNQLFAQLEYQIVNGEVAFESQTGFHERRQTFHTVFLGAGYNAPIGNKAYLTLIAQINLTTNLLYPTRQPTFRFGFAIGL